jgi:hypothetical protein
MQPRRRFQPDGAESVGVPLQSAFICDKPDYRAAHTLPRRWISKTSGTSKSAATWPQLE